MLVVFPCSWEMTFLSLSWGGHALPSGLHLRCLINLLVRSQRKIHVIALKTVLSTQLLLN